MAALYSGLAHMTAFGDSLAQLHFGISLPALHARLTPRPYQRLKMSPDDLVHRARSRRWHATQRCLAAALCNGFARSYCPCAHMRPQHSN